MAQAETRFECLSCFCKCIDLIVLLSFSRTSALRKGKRQSQFFSCVEGLTGWSTEWFTVFTSKINGVLFRCELLAVITGIWWVRILNRNWGIVIADLKATWSLLVDLNSTWAGSVTIQASISCTWTCRLSRFHQTRKAFKGFPLPPSLHANDETIAMYESLSRNWMEPGNKETFK